ncbi:MAG: hypothetical protein RBR07_04755 [Arcobacteraceae bacterium]|nr:hypothetical protein [Arcobacteraceae bacterium]
MRFFLIPIILSNYIYSNQLYIPQENFNKDPYKDLQKSLSMPTLNYDNKCQTINFITFYKPLTKEQIYKINKESIKIGRENGITVTETKIKQSETEYQGFNFIYYDNNQPKKILETRDKIEKYILYELQKNKVTMREDLYRAYIRNFEKKEEKRYKELFEKTK